MDILTNFGLMNELSFIASVVFIIVPIGSVISGWVTEPIGRKRSFIFTSIPHLIAWMLLFNSTTYAHVFWAQILIGFGQGLMEPPLITYIGEIVYVEIEGNQSCDIILMMMMNQIVS